MYEIDETMGIEHMSNVYRCLVKVFELSDDNIS
jgi:hypothetical protein